MKSILYGISNFKELITRNAYYVDKTMFIEKLERFNLDFAFFFRPRRFGKSLFLSTLEHYYDVRYKDEFEELFGELYIGKNPTPLRNSFPILKFNFSRIRGDNSIENIEDTFNLNIMSCIETFYVKYPKETGGIKVFEEDIKHLEKAEKMFDRFLEKMAQTNVKFCLLIDEYDNFANNLLAHHGKDKYFEITHGTGFLRGFFNLIKAHTETCIARLFATGVTPLVLSDVTSGFNIGDNISTNSAFHELAGFTESDVQEIVGHYVKQGIISETIRESLLDTMKKYYDGYVFSKDVDDSLYNSTAVWYLIKQFYVQTDDSQKYRIPRTLIDSNLMTDYKKLEFLVIEQEKLNGNYKTLSKLALNGECEAELVDNFAVKELVDTSKFTSFLYYLGLITIKEEGFIDTIFAIPNETCKHMLWEYIRTALKSVLRLDFSRLGALFIEFAVNDKWEPYFQMIFEKAYAALSNRDFQGGESVIKGIILGYLTQTNRYLIQSERELNKGYTDLYLEPMTWIYPKMSQMRYLIELKYLNSDEISESNKEKRVAAAKAQAVKQLRQYAEGLDLPDLPITKLVIIASNKELLLLEEVKFN